jgi:hypothetical protein
MIESSDDAVRLAILRHPEVFGLKGEDVNPLLKFTLEKSDAGDKMPDPDLLMDECLEHCELMIELRIEMVLSHRTPKGEPADKPDKPQKADGEKTPTTKSGNGEKLKAAPKENGSKITIKQLRYLGYLKHQLGAKPDYDEIENLSQKQATMLIKDLEKELSQAK